MAADLAAIDADQTKTPDEKRRAKLNTKAAAFKGNAAQNLGGQIRLPDGRRIKLNSVDLTADGLGVRVNYTWQGDVAREVVIINPPFRAADGGTDAGGRPTFSEDLIKAGLDLLARFP